jgi:hypothetical protein
MGNGNKECGKPSMSGMIHKLEMRNETCKLKPKTFFWWYWGLSSNSWLCICKAGALSIEPHLQPFLLWLFWDRDLSYAWADLNHNSPILHFSASGGMIAMWLHTQLSLLRWVTQNFFTWVHQTMVFLISASHIARIIGWAIITWLLRYFNHVSYKTWN